MDIQIPPRFGVRWNGAYLRPSKHAIREMIKLGWDLYDVAELLEDTNAKEKQRSKDTMEKTLKVGKKIYKVVVKESYACDIKEPIWLILHVGGK